jgi:hypothetical protein
VAQSNFRFPAAERWYTIDHHIFQPFNRETHAMSTNLEAAKAAIEAELAHAKQGIAHFYARIEALERTIAHLVSIDGGVLDTKPFTAMPVAKSKGETVAKPTRAAKATKAAEPAKGKAVAAKPATKTKNAQELPFTGGDFWINLVEVEPKSASEVLDAAIGKLGIKPTKEQRNKLAGRLTFAINALVKAGKIKDSGAGRARQFFRG